VSVPFDPYHVWLGIPPEEQPPNHYRLLGIGLFEVQAEVIDTAADRQMSHLRTFQSGKHADLSQRLLNEVSAARLCLLNSATRADYDERLRKRVQPRWTQPVAVQDAAAADSQRWADILGQTPTTAITRGVVRNRKTSFGPLVVVAIGGALVLAAILVRSVLNRADEGIAPVTTGDNPILVANEASSQRRTDAGAKIGTIPREPQEPAAVKAQPAAPNPPITAKPPDEFPNADAKAAVQPPVTRPTFEKPVEAVEKPLVPSFDLSSDKPSAQPTEPPVAKKRLPVPDDTKQREIAAQLAGVYAPGRAKPPQRIKLAYKILQAAKASKQPDERYVLLRQGRELAGQAGDVALVLEAIEMTGDFDIDVLQEKGDALLAFADKGNNFEQVKALYDASQRVIGQALSEGRYELAADLANGVSRACQRSKEFRKKALEQRDWVRNYSRRQTQRQAAEAKLKASPDDGDAHLLLGRCCCLDDDWKKGLPHLAKGSDAELRQLAAQDLASPTETLAQLRLADAWWTLGKDREGDEADALLLRAGYWYDRAHAKLTSGFNRLKAEKCLEEIVPIRQRRAAQPLPGANSAQPPQDLWHGLF
jgi:hypothetical protein